MDVADRLLVLASDSLVNRLDDTNVRYNMAEAFERLGYDCIKLGRLDTAISLFEGSARVNGSSASNFNYYAEAFRKLAIHRDDL
jgi:hypothetical protein